MTRDRPRSGRVWQLERDAVRARAALGEPCGICGQPIDVTLKYPDPRSCTLDHIVEVCLGGSEHDPANHQPACLDCNRRKSGRFGQLSLGMYGSGIEPFDPLTKPEPVRSPAPEW